MTVSIRCIAVLGFQRFVFNEVNVVVKKVSIRCIAVLGFQQEFKVTEWYGDF